MFWREVKRARNGMEVKEECVKDGSGHVLSHGSEMCVRWKEYFDGLLNVNDIGRAEITARSGRMLECLRKQMRRLVSVRYWERQGR